MLVDTHCHVGMYAHPPVVLDRALRAGVGVVIATARPSEFRQLLGVARPGVTVGLGMHPELAGSVYVSHELEIFQEWLPMASWISEVGLDGPIADSVSAFFGAVPSLAYQRELFESVLTLAGPDRVYSVHSRGLASLTVDTLVAHHVRNAVLHNFDGSLEDLSYAIESGYHLSVNPDMLKTDSGRELSAAVPSGRLLIETDGPYYRWKDAAIEPTDCREFLDELAALRQLSAGELERQLSANFAALNSGGSDWLRGEGD